MIYCKTVIKTNTIKNLRECNDWVVKWFGLSACPTPRVTDSTTVAVEDDQRLGTIWKTATEDQRPDHSRKGSKRGATLTCPALQGKKLEPALCSKPRSLLLLLVYFLSDILSLCLD